MRTEAAEHAGVLSREHLEMVRPFLSTIRPMPGVFEPQWVKKLHGTHVKRAAPRWIWRNSSSPTSPSSKRPRPVALRLVWCGSTEVHQKPAPAMPRSPSSEGLARSDENIAPSAIYAYACLKSGVPYANGSSPNLSVDFPAMFELAKSPIPADCRQGLQDRPDLDEDHRRAGPQAQCLGLQGWYSTNIPGKPRRRSARRSRTCSRPRRCPSSGRWSTSCSRTFIPTSYKEFHHVVRINYPPRRQ